MILTLLIICCIFVIGFFYLLHVLFIIKKHMMNYYNKMNEYKKLYEDIKNIHEQLMSFNDDVLNKLNKNTVSLIIANFIMIMNKFANEEDIEQFTYYYNRLYFLGVSKDILNDTNKLNEFYMNCLQLKYKVKDGEKPFQYKFILEEEKGNE